MKIDKIVFACSEAYAPFRNVQAQVWKEGLGIEPVCLFFGDKLAHNMSEIHGKVIEMNYLPDLPKVLQVVWSKFAWPTSEPDTTWIIGDIDMVPLQRAHFINRIEWIPGGDYAHLNADGNGRGGNYPAHYHVSKGANFRLFTENRAFEDQIRGIISAGKYGQGATGQWDQARRDNDLDSNYWLAEEGFTSAILRMATENKLIQFHSVAYNNDHGAERIDRSHMRTEHDYDYDVLRALRDEYVDVHCARPYGPQAASLHRLLAISWPELILDKP